MAIGDPLIPNSQDRVSTISVIQSISGDRNNLDYVADGSDYLSENERNQQDVYKQQVAQKLQSFDEDGISKITSDPEYQRKLAEAKIISQASKPKGDFLGGDYAWYEPGIMVYDENLKSVKKELDTAYKNVSNASGGKIDFLQTVYDEKVRKYKEMLNTDPASVAGRQKHLYVQGDMSIGKLSDAQIAASNAQTAIVLAEQVASGRMSADTARMMIDTGDSNQPTQLSSMLNYLVTPSYQTSVQQQTSIPSSNDYLSKISGYTTDLGDSKTKTLIGQGMDTRSALETQRQQALSSGDTRAARYYQNELDKSLQNVIRLSSDYHYQAKNTGLPQAVNPYENAGDVALMILKGGNQKMVFGSDGKPLNELASSYAFNKDATSVLSLLPGGKGTQENAWTAALGKPTGNLNYLPALSALKSAEKSYGPYAFLGSYDQKGNKIPVPAANIAQLPQYYQDQITAMNAPKNTNVSGFEFKAPFIPVMGAGMMGAGNIKTEITEPSGRIGIPFTEFELPSIPYISGFLKQIQKPSITTTEGSPIKGEIITGDPTPVGLPIITQDPVTGVITTTQKYQTNTTQNQTIPLITNVTQGDSALSRWSKSVMPELKQDDRSVSPLLASYLDANDKPVYLLGPEYGPKVNEATKGPLKFLSSLIPTSPQWTRETYTNIREDPAFGVPAATVSIALAGVGTGLRSVGFGSKFISPTSFGGQIYQGGSKAVTALLAGIFADYATKETTGTSLVEMGSSGIEETGQRISGITPEKTTIQKVQENFPGWDVSSQKANRLELEGLIAIGAYAGASKVGDKITGYQRTRGLPVLEKQGEVIIPSGEGFPINPTLKTRDLISSFEKGEMSTIPESNLVKTKMSITDRPFTQADFPSNPQKMAKPGTTDIYSGASYPHLNQGYIESGHSEIPGMSTSPTGLSYFTKPGVGLGSIGITNDILGIYRMPTMYVTGVKSGEYTRIPENVLHTPTGGKSINDPTNPRNIAIGEWIKKNNVPYDKPIIGQHGKSEFEYHLRAGGEVTSKPIAYYTDAGVRIPIERFKLTGKVSTKYKEPATIEVSATPTKAYKTTEVSTAPYSSFSKIIKSSSPSPDNSYKNLSKKFEISSSRFTKNYPKTYGTDTSYVKSSTKSKTGETTSTKTYTSEEPTYDKYITSSITTPRTTTSTPPSSSSLISTYYSPGYYYRTSGGSSSSSSSKITKGSSTVFPSSFMMPPGAGGGGVGFGRSRSRKIVNPLQKLTVSSSATAARFNKAFGGNFKAISTINPQGRGNIKPVMKVKSQSPRKHTTAVKVVNNINKMFGKKKKGGIF